ncbi:MAG: NAD(P)-dependent alcohol dehydrogenase [Candidatus Kapabacteria bacterium]|nr:NAD(P)-dependent alcohol dehydrogenase [Candidatus Kapabacteria bacterium]
MRAAVYHQYGAPDVVHLTSVPKPIPNPDELLIRVVATTVNRTDTGFRSAEYVVSRLFSGVVRPKFPILGCEFSGVVEAVGSRVTRFSVGDRVFGWDDARFGSHAEYRISREDSCIDIIPDGFTFSQAAALTEGAQYALHDIRAANVVRGTSVLVYGATGAIGSAAVQLCKNIGAFVTAVCGTQHTELVRLLGADEVVDYQTQDFTATERRYEFVFDAVGKRSFTECKHLLKANGIYISTELGKRGDNVWRALAAPLLRRFDDGKRVLFPLPLTKPEMTHEVRTVAASGDFNPLIDREYSLNDIVEAHRYAESGMKVGNVIVRVSE